MNDSMCMLEITYHLKFKVVDIETIDDAPCRIQDIKFQLGFEKRHYPQQEHRQMLLDYVDIHFIMDYAHVHACAMTRSPLKPMTVDFAALL